MVNREEGWVFGFFKKKGAPAPVPVKPVLRLAGFPAYADDAFVDLFGVSAEQSMQLMGIYEGLVAGEVHAGLPASIMSHTRNFARICPDVAQTLGVPKRQGDAIGSWLGYVAIVRENLEKDFHLGITEGKWMSGDWTTCATGEVRHAALDGRRFKLLEGLKIGHGHELPGVRPGCKCLLRAVVPGFSDTKF